MEAVFNHLLTLGICIALCALCYSVWLASGIRRVRKQLKKWSWARFFDDFFELIGWVYALAAGSVATDVLGWLVGKLDIPALDATVSTINAGVIIAIPLIMAAGYLYKGIKNLRSTSAFLDSTKTLGIAEDASAGENADYTGVAEKIYEIFDLTKQAEMPEDYTAWKSELETQGESGIGAYYSVPTDTYDAFKNAVLGKGFNVDGRYSWQCWDGAALLWQQFGKTLQTGNGLAIGCWTLKRNENTYGIFDLVTDVNALKPGDVVVLKPNHIGFFDGYAGDYMNILGQNQGGSPSFTQDGYTCGAFNIVRIAKSQFAGAFRLKKWNNATTPTNNTTPAKTAAKLSNDEVAQLVLAGKYGNQPERQKKLEAEGYNYYQVQAIVDALVAKKSHQKATPAPSGNGTVSYTYKAGDTFGQVILNLGLNTNHGLWGDDGDVAYYTKQLHAQGITGNIPIGTTIKLTPRKG